MYLSGRLRIADTQRRATCGFTLIEVALAMAVFTVVVGIAAQALTTFYVTMDMQRQRVLAVNHCRATVSEMRSLRDANRTLDGSSGGFQSVIFERFPPAAKTAGPTALRGSEVTVTYENPSANANPLVPTVTIRWLDLRGRTMAFSLSSAITDR